MSVTGFNSANQTVRYVGNYLDYSDVMYHEETTLTRGICGWYFAYDKLTNYNAGFAPMICNYD